MVEQKTFADFRQVGLIVADIDRAIEGLNNLGIGPFRPLDAEPTVRWEEGGKAAEIRSKTRFAYSGSFEIELIEPISPSMQKEFLETQGGGIHHIGFFVEDIDKEVEIMAEKGYKVIQRGWRPTSGGYAYFDTEQSCGVILEIIQR
jgi:catechol 2,3-dioxygenase-like lactoylglutathione lyase family enzyme